VDNSGVDNMKLYTQPEDVWDVYRELSSVSPYFSIAAAFGNVHGVCILRERERESGGGEGGRLKLQLTLFAGTRSVGVISITSPRETKSLFN